MIVMVKFNNVKKQYKDFCLDCSIEIPKGQITGIIGRNGAGKTTAFKAMLGLIKIDGGTIELFGKDVQKLTAQDRQSWRGACGLGILRIPYNKGLCTDACRDVQ